MKSANAQATPPSWEFYDLETDPNELKNVFNEPSYQDLIVKMHASLINEKAFYEDHQTPVPDLEF